MREGKGWGGGRGVVARLQCLGCFFQGIALSSGGYCNSLRNIIAILPYERCVCPTFYILVEFDVLV